MSRIAVSLLVALGLLCTVFATAALAEEVKCTGTIAKIEGNQVTVQAGSEQHEMTVAPATKITLDGKPAKINELKVGFKCRATCNKEGDKLSCQALEVTTSAQ